MQDKVSGKTAQSQEQHTPGPWETPGQDGGSRVISFRDSHGKRRTLAHVYNGKPGSMEANARRIVACVNACEGIDNPLQFRLNLVTDLNSISVECDQFREQNKELVKALELLKNELQEAQINNEANAQDASNARAAHNVVNALNEANTTVLESIVSLIDEAVNAKIRNGRLPSVSELLSTIRDSADNQAIEARAVLAKRKP